LEVKEFEQRVIAKMIQDPAALGYAIIYGQKPKHFETTEGARIYEILMELAEKMDTERISKIGFTAVKLYASFKYPDDAQKRAIVDYVEECKRYGDDDSFEITYEEWNRRMEMSRFYVAIRESVAKARATNDINEAHNYLLSQVISKPNGVVDLVDLDGFEDRNAKRKEDKSLGRSFVVPTGFPTMDDILEGGMRPGEICVIGGDTGFGKSFFVTCLGIYAKVAGYKVLHIITENTIHQQMGRADAIYHDLDYRDVQSGILGIDPKKVAADIRGDRHLTVRLFSGEYGVSDVIRIIEWAKLAYRFDPEVIIIDSPDLLDADTSVPEYARGRYNYILRHMYRQLQHYVQKNLKILFTTSQLNMERKTQREKKGLPGISDFSDSRDKERTADVLAIIFANEEMQSLGVIGVNLVKGRDTAQQLKPFMIRRVKNSPRFVEVEINEAGVRVELDPWPIDTQTQTSIC